MPDEKNLLEMQHKKNRLGIAGWVYGGRYGAERYAYTLHRITGLGILFYFILHIFATGSRIWGEEAWTRTMELFDKPLYKAGEFLVFVAFAYHALNGLRLLFTELGFWMGKPQRPVIPYKNAVRRQRPALVILMIIALVIIVLGGFDFYFYGE